MGGEGVGGQFEMAGATYAAQLLRYPGSKLPVYQELRRDHPSILVPWSISFEEAFHQQLD